MSSSLKGLVYPIENERAGLLREWVMDGYGQFWFLCNGFRQTLVKLLIFCLIFIG
jgi:hypothetical protein